MELFEGDGLAGTTGMDDTGGAAPCVSNSVQTRLIDIYS
jgi:hypothetical protein